MVKECNCSLDWFPYNPLNRTSMFGGREIIKGVQICPLEDYGNSVVLEDNDFTTCNHTVFSDHIWWRNAKANSVCTETCPVPCDETTFDVQKSEVPWPTSQEEAIRAVPSHLLDRYLEDEGLEYMTLNEAWAYKLEKALEISQRDFAKIEIDLSTLKSEVFTSSPKYEPFTLLSALGGLLGLFTGFSVLTGMEFLELAADVTVVIVLKGVHSIRKLLGKRSQVDPWPAGGERGAL